jgi:O-antigen/teichoic acid export membrane protein
VSEHDGVTGVLGGGSPVDDGADTDVAAEVRRRQAPAMGRPGVTRTETRRHVRGSSLLLVGRVGALGANLITQVLIARYLTKSDFGAFAYALSLVTLAESVVTLGLDRAIPRFLPLYQERGEYDKFTGTLVFVVSTLLSLSLVVILLVYGLAGILTGGIINNAQAVPLLLILIFLAPLDTLDTVFTGIFSVVASARAIFVRKYVLAPGLRFLVVVLLILGQLQVPFLAAGYVAAGAIGVALYVSMLPAMLRQAGIARHVSLSRMRISLREILSYTVPLLSTDLVLAFMTAFDALILGKLHGAEAVGALSVVDPAARTNSLVLVSFSLMFVPVATRYFARNDHEAMNDLYWQTAAWMAVLSFPIFAVTFALATPLTVTLYEQRYEGSAILLSLLAVGRYLDASFGANGFALRVYGRMRPLVAVNLLAAAFHMATSVLLIPPLGALGAAMSVCVTLVVYNVAKQVALQLYTGVRMFDPRYLRVYLSIAVAAAALALVTTSLRPSLASGIVLAGVASIGVLLVSRRRLRVADTFPEVLRLPGARMLFGA